MNNRQAGNRQVAEIRYGAHPGAIAAVGAHPLHTFWPLLSPHFRAVWLAPQRRSDGASVSWVWRQAAEKREPGAQDLATLRRRLQESAAGFSEDPLGSVDETVARATSEAVVRQVCSRAAEVVAALVAKSDPDLAAYVAMTETGLRLHSWGADVPAQPQDPAAQQCEVSGTVFAADKPAARFTVALENSRGLTLARTESDPEGHFAFPDVGPGSYRLRVLSDQVPFSVKGVAVRVEQESVRGIELRSHSLIEAPEDDAMPPVEAVVVSPPPPSTPAVPAAPAGTPRVRRRSRRRLLLLLLLLFLLIGGGARFWLAQDPSPATPVQPSTFVAYDPPAFVPPPRENSAGAGTADPGVNLGAAVDRPRLGSSAPPADFASRTRLASAPVVAAGALSTATAAGPDGGLGATLEAAGATPGSPNAAATGGASAPEAASAGTSPPPAGESTTAVDAPPSSGAGPGGGGAKGAITTAQPAGDSKPVTPPRHTSPRPTHTPRLPRPEPAPDDPDDGDVALDADARAERAARRAVSDARAAADEEARSATDASGADTDDMSTHADSAGATPSANPEGPDGPPEHKDPLDERPDREDEHIDPEQPEDETSDEERIDPEEAPFEDAEERQDEEAPVADDSSASSPSSRDDVGRKPAVAPTTRGTGGAAAGAAATAVRRSSPRTPKDDAAAARPGAEAADDRAVDGPDAGLSLKLRIETWHPRLEADVIVPTAPVPVDKPDTTRALLHDVQAEATSRLPELFRPPITQSGLVLEVGAEVARAGAMRWSRAAPSGVNVRCQGSRAEIGWAGQVPPVSESWTLQGADGNVLARIRTDRNGGVALETAPEVRASFWVGVRRSLSDSRPEHARRWAARLRWSLQHGAEEAPAGHRDDSWLGASGHRLEFPLPLRERAFPAITIRLSDRESGWALVRRIHLR